MTKRSDKTGNSISRILSGSSVIFAASLINKAISFVASVFMASILGDTGYGMVALALPFLFIISGILNFGFPEGVARNYPRAVDESERRGLLVTPFVVAIPLAIIGSGMLFLAAEPISVGVFGDSNLVVVLQIVAIAIPINVLLNLLLGTLRAVERPVERSLARSIVFPIVRFSVIITLVMLGYGAAGATGAYVAAAALAAMIALYYVHKHTPLFDRDIVVNLQARSLLSFSIPLMGSAIIIQLMNNADTLLIGVLIDSVGSVGQYNAAFVLAQTTLLFYTSLGFMYVPEVSRLHEGKGDEEAKEVYQVMTKWILFISLPFTLTAFVFPEFILTFIYTPAYTQATLPFVTLMLGLLTHVMVGHNKNTLIAFGDTRAILLTDVTTLLVNIFLNVALIPKYGILGAAVATSTAYVIRNTTLSLYLYAEYDIQPFTQDLLLTAVVPIVVATILVSASFTPSFPVIFLTTLILMIATVGSYLRYGVSAADIFIVNQIEIRFKINLDPIRDIHKRLR